MMSAAAGKERGILSAAIYAGWVVMDVFGLGSLVDKIGERFGNRVRDALLFLVAVAAFVLCLHAIITYGVIPVIEFVRGVSSKSALGLLSTVILGALLGGTAGVVFQFVLRLLLKRIMARAEEATKRADALIDDVKALLAETQACAAEARAIVQEGIEKIEKDAEEEG